MSYADLNAETAGLAGGPGNVPRPGEVPKPPPKPGKSWDVGPGSGRASHTLQSLFLGSESAGRRRISVSKQSLPKRHWPLIGRIAPLDP